MSSTSVVKSQSDDQGYSTYDTTDRSNALILMPAKKTKTKKTEAQPQPAISKEMLKKIAKLEEKKIRKAERFKALEIINEQNIADDDRILLSKSSTLGSKLTMKERMAYAYRASKLNIETDQRDASRMEAALLEAGDWQAANEVLAKKNNSKVITHNPFAQVNSSHASLQAILNDSMKSTTTGQRYTRAELSKFVNNIEDKISVDDQLRKQEKKRARRLENQMYRSGQANVTIIPKVLQGVSHLITGEPAPDGSTNSSTSSGGINPADLAKKSKPTSSIAAIGAQVSATATSALQLLNQGLSSKKRKKAIDTLFEMDDMFADDDDDDGDEDNKDGAKKDTPVEITTTDSIHEAAVNVHMGIPKVFRTDKAAVLSRNKPIAILATADSTTGDDAGSNSKNPYAVDFKVVSAKPAVRRAALAAKLATLDERSRRRIFKEEKGRSRRVFMGGSEYDLDDVDTSEDDDDDDTEQEEEEEEEEKPVRFESWDLVKKYQNQGLKSTRKVLFSAANGPIATTAVPKTNTNTSVNNNNNSNTSVNTTTTTAVSKKSSMKDDDNSSDNAMSQSEASDSDDMNDDDTTKENGTDGTEEMNFDDMMQLLANAMEGDEGEEGEGEGEGDLMDYEGEEDDEGMMLADEDDDDAMVLYDDEAGEDSEDLEPPAKKQVTVEDLLPPRKGVRFDGSKLSFQDLLQRVRSDLFADDGEEEDNTNTTNTQKDTKQTSTSSTNTSNTETSGKKRKILVDDSKNTGKSVSTKTTTPATATTTEPNKTKKTIITVNRKPEIENARLQLPVCAQEQEIMEAITNNDVVILSGETGSGKTTQVPQFLYEYGYANDGFIAVTQPRRVAAMSSAKRVAEELNAVDTNLVGYQIRYDNQVTEDTKIKMMTEGVLLREIQFDFLLKKYSVIIIDEAHERGLNTDVLLGLLSRIVQLRNSLVDKKIKEVSSKDILFQNTDTGSNTSNSTSITNKNPLHGLKMDGVSKGKLKIIIMSATLRTTDFTQNPLLFPIPPPIVEVQSRQYPVSMHFSRVTTHDYVQKALQKVMRVHTRLPPGGILVFLTGRAEIDQFCKQLEEIFPKPVPGKDNSVDSYVKIGSSNLKTKAIKSLRQTHGKLNMNDPKIQKMISQKMIAIKKEADKHKKKKIVYKKGQPFSLTEIEQDEQGIMPEFIDIEDEETLQKAATEIVMEEVIKAMQQEEDGDGDDANTDKSKKDGSGTSEDGEMEDEFFELSDDDDYEDPIDSDDDDEEEEEEEGSDMSDTEEGEDGVRAKRKYVTTGTNKRKIAIKKDSNVLETETSLPSSINDKWLSELEAMKRQEQKPPMLVLPLYALLSSEAQMRIFKHHEYTHGARLVVVATNVAETSVTIPGIKYVIDTGREKRKVYDQATGSSKFEIGFIAQSSANQRAGRAGRTGPGHCYRLYSGAVFDEQFEPHTVPEVLRQPIESTILQMKSIGINDITTFPFPTPPPIRTIQVACHSLYLLGALEQILDKLVHQKNQQYYKLHNTDKLIRDKSNTSGSTSSSGSGSGSGSSFHIAAPKKAWELSAMAVEEEIAKKQAELLRQQQEEENKEEAERKALLESLQAQDQAFCIHGQEFVDTSSLNITPTGKAMSVFPLHPRFSKLLLSAANQEGCLPYAIVMTAILTINELRVKPAALRLLEQQEAQEEHRKKQQEGQTGEAKTGKDEDGEDDKDDNDGDNDDDEEEDIEAMKQRVLVAKEMEGMTPEEENKYIRDKVHAERSRMKAERRAKLAEKQSAEKERMKQLREKWNISCAKWCDPNSDILTLLRIIGGFVYTRHAYAVKQWKNLENKGIKLRGEKCYENLPNHAKPAVNKKMQQFCDDNFIRMKAMNELLQLREQLTNLVLQRVMATTTTTSTKGSTGGSSSNNSTFSDTKTDASFVSIGEGDADEQDDEETNGVTGVEDHNSSTDTLEQLTQRLESAKFNAMQASIIKSLSTKAIPPPSPTQEIALTQILTTGFLDKIARKMTEESKQRVIKYSKKYSLIPQRRFYPRDVKNKLEILKNPRDIAELIAEVPLNIRDLDDAYEDMMTGEPVFLSPDSVLAHALPEVVVYSEMSRDVGRRRKTVIAGLTSINIEWLHKLATPLCTFSRVLEEPLPVFDRASDQVKCYVNATIGPNLWDLPLVLQSYQPEETNEIVQDYKTGRNVMRTTVRKPFVYYKHLARLILEGYVFVKLRNFRPYYNNRPMAVLATPMPTQAYTLANELMSRNITGIEDCKRIWYGHGKQKPEPTWLFDEISAWIHSAKRIELKRMWPPIGKHDTE